MYHRLDGKLVAVGNLDLCKKTMNSAYFLYDPDYRHLSLGVVGALIEIEYMRMVRAKFNSKLRFYHLGELIVTNPKLNYKLNYSGGLVLCPETFSWVPLQEALPRMQALASLTIEQKSMPGVCRLDLTAEPPAYLRITEEMEAQVFE